MNEFPISKPRVFLSCSEKDSEFIERLNNDLIKKCQVETWLYKYELRHGKPWLDAIFRNGIPTCDAIIAYITASSLSSPVVSKEIDAGILQTLNNNNVAFLPYVNDSKLRSSLRPDIQSLQVPEWNEENYFDLLPTVVAEIWRSFLERTVVSAIRDERLKRVETELELEKYKGQPEEIFSKSEYKEFEYIWNSFDKKVPLGVTKTEYDIGMSTTHVVHNCILYLQTLVALLSDYLNNQKYFEQKIRQTVSDCVHDILGKEKYTYQIQFDSDVFTLSRFKDELFTFNLIEDVVYASNVEGQYVEHELLLSKKYFRFRYWLAYHHKMPDHLAIEISK